MKITTIKCDLCRKEAKSYRYESARQPDPSGNGYEIEFKFIDLCFNCLQYFIRKNPNYNLLES